MSIAARLNKLEVKTCTGFTNGIGMIRRIYGTGLCECRPRAYTKDYSKMKEAYFQGTKEDVKDATIAFFDKHVSQKYHNHVIIIYLII